MKKIICIIFFLYTLPLSYVEAVEEPLISAEYSYRRYSINDGLPDNQCWSIFQDSKGFIWIGTGGGFSRYNGHKFESYLDKSENAAIHFITESQKGNIIAFSENNINMLDREGTLSQGAIDYDWFIWPLASKNFTNEYALFTYKNENRAAMFSLQDSLKTLICEFDKGAKKNLKISTIGQIPYWDKANKRIYISTNYGISIFSEEGIEVDSIACPTICQVIPFRNELWAIGPEGIYKISGKEMQQVYKYDFLYNPPQGVGALVDNDNNMIIRTIYSVYCFDGTALEVIFNGYGVTDILLDRENNLWIATYDGLYNCYRRQFKNYAYNDKSYPINSIVADQQGNVWSTSLNGELMVLNNSAKRISYPRIKDETYFSGRPVKIENGLYFPGAYKEDNYGMLYIEGEKSKWLYPTEDKLCYYIKPFTGGNILFAEYYSIFICNPNGSIIKKYSSEDFIQYISCIETDNKQGLIYIGGIMGVTIIDGDSIRLIPSKKHCHDILIDKDQTVWVASGNELCHLKNDSLIPIYTFPDYIRGFYFTNKNVLIVLQTSGFYISAQPDKGFIYYDKNNGFTGEHFPGSNIIEGKDGYIWLLASKTVVSFKPEKLLQKEITPLLHLTSVRFSDNNINWKRADETGHPIFTHNEKNIRFDYIGLCYSAAENVRYQYRLKGFQDDWSEYADNREVTFNNLSPGKYEFQLRADAGSPETATVIETFPFTINPAFWQTAWFWMIVVILFITLFGGAIIRFLKKKHDKEIRMAYREKEMNELRVQSVRLKSIPHFNSNVLAGIEYLILTNNKEDANSLLATYSVFTNLTLHEIDKAERSLKDEIEYATLYLELEKMRYKENLSFTFDVSEQVNLSVMIPNMVLHTYTENAVKHGIRGKKEPGNIIIKVVNKENGVLLSVEDDGIGREASHKRNPERKGHGLSILTRQIELYNQQNYEKIKQAIIDLKDEFGNACGTRFELYIPYVFQYL